MLDTRLIEKLEELFKEDPFDTGEVTLLVTASNGRVEVKEAEVVLIER